ncbi:MAG: hypothetical protein BWY61_00633 [Firmicutes bacterium ADurb.Bin354]|nr:MAG: hypothetical protein BWY61_00633 [Firmicutes bacterium ADurb.Bin354]
MKKTVKIILLLFFLISIPIIIRGIRRYGNNWIDISKDPSICYYDGNVYYEISNTEYLGIKGDEFEYMDRYIVNGAKANLLVYYLPTIMTYRVGESESMGTVPIDLYNSKSRKVKKSTRTVPIDFEESKTAERTKIKNA